FVQGARARRVGVAPLAGAGAGGGRGRGGEGRGGEADESAPTGGEGEGVGRGHCRPLTKEAAMTTPHHFPFAPSRRGFVGLSAAAFATVAMSACGSGSGEEIDAEAQSVGAM